MKGIAGGNFVYLKKCTDTLILAKNRKNGEKVAIKSWNEDDILGIRETRIWEDFYKDCFIESKISDGKRILVRKWIEGESLAKVRENSRGISPERAADILTKIIDVVIDFQNRTGMFVGDLSPSNIIISSGIPKLVDFETASSPGDDETEFFSKKRTMNYGTPYYFAPEIIMGEGTFKSDVFSLGMIYLYLIFSEPNKGRIQEVDKKYGAFIRRATDVNARDRFPSLSDMRNNLLSILEKTPVISEIRNNEPTLKLVPRAIRGYRKNIIYVRNNPAFVAELSYVFSKIYGLKTCAVEVCDYDNGSLDYFIQNEDENSALFASEDEAIYIKKDDAYCNRTAFDENLYSKSYKVDSYDYLNDESMRDFMGFAYDNFDVTIVCDSLSETNANHLQFIRFSDQVILAVSTDLDKSQRQILYYNYLFKSNKISTNKLKVVGFGFDEEISSDVEFTAEKNNVKFIGYIDKNNEREKCVNRGADFFVKKMGEDEIDSYCRIIERIIL